MSQARGAGRKKLTWKQSMRHELVFTGEGDKSYLPHYGDGEVEAEAVPQLCHRLWESVFPRQLSP